MNDTYLTPHAFADRHRSTVDGLADGTPAAAQIPAEANPVGVDRALSLSQTLDSSHHLRGRRTPYRRQLTSLSWAPGR
jgi:hypothetical protein